jgi:hypothetical protein
VRAHAATGYAGGPLSHISAPAVHGVVDQEVTRLNVTVLGDRRVRTSRWLPVHRTRNPCRVVRARGLPATTIARSLIDTWGDAVARSAMRGFDAEARGALIRATREKDVAVHPIAAELDVRPQLPGCQAMAELLGLVARGCRSELEIFGVQHVRDVPRLPRCHRQDRVLLAPGPIRLARPLWPDVELAVELDGAAFHGGQSARERDLRRDNAPRAQTRTSTMIATMSRARYEIDTWNSCIGLVSASRRMRPSSRCASTTNQTPRPAAAAV